MHTHTHLPKHQHTRRRAKQVGRMKEKKSWRTHNGGKHCELYKPFFSLIGVYLGPAARLFVQKIGKYSVFSFTSKFYYAHSHTRTRTQQLNGRAKERGRAPPQFQPRGKERERCNRRTLNGTTDDFYRFRSRIRIPEVEFLGSLGEKSTSTVHDTLGRTLRRKR